MDASLLFDLDKQEPAKRRSFTIIKGEIPPLEVVDAIPAEQIVGNEWAPQNFAELDAEIAVRAALMAQSRSVAEARLADAKHYEQQIEGMLRKYHYLVPHPAGGKAWKESIGEFSGGKYRYQPDRAPKYEIADKEAAREAGLMTTYTSWRLETKLVHEYEATHGKDIPGVTRTEPCPVSFKSVGKPDES